MEISYTLKTWYRDIQRTPHLDWLKPYLEGRKLSDRFIDLINTSELMNEHILSSRETIVRVVNLALKSREDKVKEYVE